MEDSGVIWGFFGKKWRKKWLLMRAERFVQYESAVLVFPVRHPDKNYQWTVEYIAIKKSLS